MSIILKNSFDDHEFRRRHVRERKSRRILRHFHRWILQGKDRNGIAFWRRSVVVRKLSLFVHRRKGSGKVSVRRRSWVGVVSFVEEAVGSCHSGAKSGSSSFSFLWARWRCGRKNVDDGSVSFRRVWQACPFLFLLATSISFPFFFRLVCLIQCVRQQNYDSDQEKFFILKEAHSIGSFPDSCVRWAWTQATEGRHLFATGIRCIFPVFIAENEKTTNIFDFLLTNRREETSQEEMEEVRQIVYPSNRLASPDCVSFGHMRHERVLCLHQHA